MHKLLARQVERHLGPAESLPPAMRELLLAVDAVYRRADLDRDTALRSIELLSRLMEAERARRDERRALRPKKAQHRLDKPAGQPVSAGPSMPAGLSAPPRPAEPPGDERRRYEAALDALDGGLFEWDLVSGRVHFADAARRLLGIPGSDAPLASEWLDRVLEADRAQLEAALRAHFDGVTQRLEFEHRLAGAEQTWISVRAKAVRGAGGPVKLAGFLSDVTARRRQREQMEHDARHDPLTGLANRALFIELLRHSFHRMVRRDDYGFAVVFFDLDGFKSVNDTLGHAAGDELLVEVARRVQACLRQGDTLARHGGDEFTACLDDLKSPAEAARVAMRIHQAMADPVRIGGHELQASISIGICIASRRHADPDEVLRDADTAMYRAKALGRGRTVVLEERAEPVSISSLNLEAELRRAITRREFRVHYLPIIDVATGKLDGLEALVRWEHPQRGLVGPDNFMPVAEETGLIVPIGKWVLGEASRQLRDWRRELGAGARFPISVNVSSRQLLERDLPAQIDEALRESGLRPGDLNLDISEHTMEASANSGEVLGALHKRGLRLSIDDFGTGAASLTHLHRDDMDAVKIDRSFIRGIKTQADRNVLSTLIGLARTLGKQVIAEGVETQEQLSVLRDAGCGSAQGYLFSAPVDGPHAHELIERGLIARVG